MADHAASQPKPASHTLHIIIGVPTAVFGLIIVLVSLLSERGDTVSIAGLIVGLAFLVIGIGVSIPSGRDFLLQVFRVTTSSVSPGKQVKSPAKATAAPAKEATAAPPKAVPLAGSDKPATKIVERWRSARGTRRPVLDLIGPTYILDDTFHFLDWNPAFETIVAKPLGLVRGQHAEAFVAELANCDAVVERAKSTFQPNHYPLVDMEELVLDTEAYGQVKFRKLAAQIANEHGEVQAWSVNLDVTEAGDKERLWNDVRASLERYVNWSRYAASYDKLLLNFDEYRRLLELVVAKVGNAATCIDLGAGTGNGTIELLKGKADREVWAIEPNESMLEFLREKVAREDPGGAAEMLSRLYVVKGRIERMNDIQSDYFDAAIMTNVLYAVEDPVACLREAHRVLQRGGVLALSTSSEETDIEKLFTRLKEELNGKDLYEELKENWEDARQRHMEMEGRIHRDSKDDIRRYLDEAGFDIEDWHNNAYVDAVVVVKAVKR